MKPKLLLQLPSLGACLSSHRPSTAANRSTGFYLQHGEEICAKARACAAAQGVEQEEALQAVAGLRCPPQPLQQLLVVLGPVDMMALGPVVPTPTHIAQHLPPLKQSSHLSLHLVKSRLTGLAYCCSECVRLAFPASREAQSTSLACSIGYPLCLFCMQGSSDDLHGLLVPHANTWAWLGSI